MFIFFVAVCGLLLSGYAVPKLLFSAFFVFFSFTVSVISGTMLP